METRSLSRFPPVALLLGSSSAFPSMGYLEIRVLANELLPPPITSPFLLIEGASNLPIICQDGGYKPSPMSPISRPPRMTLLLPLIRKLGNWVLASSQVPHHCGVDGVPIEGLSYEEIDFLRLGGGPPPGLSITMALAIPLMLLCRRRN